MFFKRDGKQHIGVLFIILTSVFFVHLIVINFTCRLLNLHSLLFYGRYSTYYKCRYGPASNTFWA